MPSQSQLIEDGRRYLAKNYKQLPVVFTHGEGSWLVDAEGHRYLDCISGIATCALGHAPKLLQETIAAQAGQLLHVSNLYFNEPAIRLARFLCEHSFAERVFFCNSGGEANEAAVKLARRYHREVRGEDRYEILCMEGSFHGRTLGMIAATGQEKYRQGFAPIPQGFRHVPFGDLSAARRAVHEHTAAIMVEPIQGEGGMVVPPEGYLVGLRNLCDEHGLLLIFDEVQSGMGRTGRLFGYEHEGITPDIMTLAKALGGGFPIGAMLSTEIAAGGFAPGMHASTFGGNALACATALTVCQTIAAPEFLDGVVERARHLYNALDGLRSRFACVKEVRGRGLWLGVVVDIDGAKIVEKALEKGLLINHIGGKVLRFAPALNISTQELDEAVRILAEVLQSLQSAQAA